MRIGIAGVGGIGSNVAMHLVRAGVTAFRIVDFDKVDPSNLNRQFYFAHQVGQSKVQMLVENLRAIRPEVQIDAREAYIDETNIVSLFQDCDCVVEGFDKAESKVILLKTFWNSGKYLVSANGVAGNDVENIRIYRPKPTIAIVGDFVSDVATHPLSSAKVGSIAAMMAGIVLDWANMFEKSKS
ncbi:sulfur carrier protein ThiS adenylyltransferase ThiF [Thermospira aquatica]|uniref:Sulfur carrier protein ThiS adenylyltransferase ThiF n=1 Tax=Thermospira aquatica TaxID=2828656 RepID=A0AAX3BFQ1_9SPIR|nr:sulfur carrier protein ThiS adenylyltransferase ThiF [Thermospira aquatica]URA11031.1 sulfur carrier protein ThiS adenylyltransferase ThiF [Thermospira aquatica]